MLGTPKLLLIWQRLYRHTCNSIVLQLSSISILFRISRDARSNPVILHLCDRHALLRHQPC